MSNHLEGFFELLNTFDWQHPPRWNEPLAEKTSVGTGGPAAIYMELANLEEVRRISGLVQGQNLPVFIIGRGTNLLVQDQGVPGLVVRLTGEFDEVEDLGKAKLRVGAAVPDARLARICRDKGLTGMEFLSTVPGTLGGAIFMNAGAYGQEIRQSLISVQVWDVKSKALVELSNDRLCFAYRSSLLMRHPHLWVLSALFQLKTDDPNEIGLREKRWIEQRKATQPVKEKTWGSVFVNPPGHAAGKLIEDLGFKGKGVGGARVSVKHANFIENYDHASFGDLLKTVKMIQDEVQATHGIQLRMEGRILPPLEQDQDE